MWRAHCMLKGCDFERHYDAGPAESNKEVFMRAYSDSLTHSWSNKEDADHTCRIEQGGALRALVRTPTLNPWRSDLSRKVDELREKIVAVKREVVGAIRHAHEHGFYPQLSDAATVLLNSISLIPEEHTMQHHCIVDDETLICVVCGVGHETQCDICGAYGYHALPCILVDLKRAFEPIQPLQKGVKS